MTGGAAPSSASQAGGSDVRGSRRAPSLSCISLPVPIFGPWAEGASSRHWHAASRLLGGWGSVLGMAWARCRALGGGLNAGWGWKPALLQGPSPLHGHATQTQTKE